MGQPIPPAIVLVDTRNTHMAKSRKSDAAAARVAAAMLRNKGGSDEIISRLLKLARQCDGRNVGLRQHRPSHRSARAALIALGLACVVQGAHATSIDRPAICAHMLEAAPADHLRIVGPGGIDIDCAPHSAAKPVVVTVRSIADMLSWQFNHGWRTVIAGEEQAETSSVAYWNRLKVAQLDDNAVIAPSIVRNPFN